jgi:glycosyltransferase involved in cell wall biosynthesis
MNSPLISVIMNCYNGEKYLDRALKSVLNQDYDNLELIFWDNLSSDNSKKIFEKFNDKRLKYFKGQKHKILYEARNDALKECKGEYISFLDVDDYWFKNKLSLQVSIMEKNKNIGLIYGNYIKFNENKFFFKKKKLNTKYFKSGIIKKELIENYNIGLLTVLIRKSFMVEELKFFDSRYNLLADFDYILRFSKKYYIDFVKEELGVYHQHENQLQSISADNQAKQFNNWFNLKVLKENLFGKECNYNNIIKKIEFLNFLSRCKKKKNFSFFKDLILYPNNFYKIKIILTLLLPEKINKRIFSLT